MRHVITLSLLLYLLPAHSRAAETASDIIRKVDGNQVFSTETFKAKMVIAKDKRTLTKTFYGYGQKQDMKSFMEFTNPEDKGVKYLKLDDELWIYFPDADDVMKISGHMLRQGMMGSDISYEDMLENDSIEEKYDSRLLEDKQVDGRECYVVELQAKKPDVTYDKQVIVVDKVWYIPLEIELYARGGRLLKTMKQSEVQKLGERFVPMRITIRDMRRRNSQTVVTFEEIAFDGKVPAKVFTKGYLKR
ncbi:outer membrane lipoprotein-sorting protein [candidate division FCPU426 bacterium]|nr:outer membrane lipoprotein-sorting protein [candidate division FCPU426 bacterium]